MAIKLTNKDNEKLKLQDPEYGEKSDKRGKSETHVVGYDMARNMKNVQNEKQTLQDLENGEKQ